MNTGLPFPWTTLFRLAGAIVMKRRLDFSAEARAAVRRLRPPPLVEGDACIPAGQPLLVVTNHYSAPGFRAWWLTLAISAAIPAPVHWVVTAAWTFPDPLRSRLLTPATRWAFARMAQVYGFTSMPPMPPRTEEAGQRARAVRQVLAYARCASLPVVGLAPEGGDSPGGALQSPPPGVGRFMLHLSELGLLTLPVGIRLDAGRLRLRFGAPFRLEAAGGTSQERDRAASRQVMAAIAELL